MTKPKYVAGTLTSILENPMVLAILDRGASLDGVIDEALSWWDYDLFKRKPSPAYSEYGIFVGTDLDLACFMYALAGRGAIINIPYYKSHTQTKMREDQQLKSKDNRHGELLSVGANKYFFSFNINVIDQNVIGEDKIGDYRTFSMTDKTGEWYDGWRSIQFEPTLRENRFITENALWSGHKVVFKNFIHPNRWTSFFGQHYVISKLLIDRLEDEAKHLNTEIKRLQSAGFAFPEGQGPASYSYNYGASKQEKFTAFECKIHMPASQISGEYKPIDDSQQAMIDAYDLRKDYNKSLNKLRFMTRASEYAHYKNPERMPMWLKNVKWESGFREPGKRTDWDRIKLFQPKVGEYSVSILKRTYQKSATVSAD